MITKLHRSGVLAAGLALFSMFFGAGDLIWPLIVGGHLGQNNIFGVWGFLVSGVSLPLLGLFAMMTFEGNYIEFFRRAGRAPGAVMLFCVQMILGPFGSLPRLITLSHATLQPYLPSFISLLWFSILASILVLFMASKKNQIVDILGIFLSPMMLLTLGAILFIGLWNPPFASINTQPAIDSVVYGLNAGYNTLDLIASFIFAPLVYSYFKHDETTKDREVARKHVYQKMTYSCLIAGFLLGGMYLGMTFLASFYTPLLPEHLPEQRLALISIRLLGSYGGLISCVGIALSCLTTSVPIAAVVSDYVSREIIGNKKSQTLSLVLILGISCILANIGFMGIANLLAPILQVLCPSLIVLSILNLVHKLKGVHVSRWPIYVTFVLSILLYAYTNS